MNTTYAFRSFCNAVFGDDFDEMSFTVTFEINAADGTERMTAETVSILADSALEGPHSFTVAIVMTPFLEYSVGSRNVLTVNIMDTADCTI